MYFDEVNVTVEMNIVQLRLVYRNSYQFING